MKINDLENFRNSYGYLELDKIKDKRTQPNIVGVKPKTWLLLDDGRVLFKETNPISYEDIAHLFFAEFLEQCELEHATYDLAILNGKRGVITPDFTKEGELLITGETLLSLLKTTYDQNNINQTVSNSIGSIIEALRLINVDEKIINETKNTLIKGLIMDALLLETDRNPTNWSIKTEPKYFNFIKDPQNKSLTPFNHPINNFKLAPFYDGSNIFGLNRNVNDLQTKVRNIRDLSTIQSIILNSKRSFFMNNETQDQPLIEELKFISQHHPNIINDFIPKLMNLSVDLAKEKIEAKIKTQILVDIIIWIGIILKYNKENIIFACQDILKNEKTR